LLAPIFDLDVGSTASPLNLRGGRWAGVGCGAERSEPWKVRERLSTAPETRLPMAVVA